MIGRGRSALAAALIMTGLHWPCASQAAQGPAYVSDELVLGLYAEPNGQGQKLATLHSGTALQTLATLGEYTQVHLPDGTTGWVKSTYLTAREPAAARIKQLQEELDRTRATTPGLAAAAARSENERLQQELAAAQEQLAAARAELQAGPGGAGRAAPRRPAPPAAPAPPPPPPPPHGRLAGHGRRAPGRGLAWHGAGGGPAGSARRRLLAGLRDPGASYQGPIRRPESVLKLP